MRGRNFPVAMPAYPFIRLEVFKVAALLCARFRRRVRPSMRAEEKLDKEK